MVVFECVYLDLLQSVCQSVQAGGYVLRVLHFLSNGGKNMLEFNEDSTSACFLSLC